MWKTGWQDQTVKSAALRLSQLKKTLFNLHFILIETDSKAKNSPPSLERFHASAYRLQEELG